MKCRAQKPYHRNPDLTPMLPVNWWDPDGKVSRSCVIATPACQTAIEDARACVTQAFDLCIARKGWTPLIMGGGDSDQPITSFACAAEAKEKCQAEIDYAINFCNFAKETCGLTAGGK